MKRQRTRPIALGAVLLMALTAGCGSGEDSPEPVSSPVIESPAPGDAPEAEAEAEDSAAQQFPDVLDVALTQQSATSYNVAVTISSPYDTPQRYADGWRVLTPDGVELGAHTLLHDHAGEQPFTRTQSGLEIPASVDRIIVEGRDLVYGYGGTTMEAAVPR